MNQKTMFVVKSAVIAALYAALTMVSSAFGLAYGQIQFRISEALCVLCAFTPTAIPGLTIGCLISNLGSPFGAVDIILGTFATFAAATLGYYTRNLTVKKLPLLTLLFPAVCNGIIVGAEIAYFMPDGFKWGGFALSGLEVAAGEIAVCFTLGIILFKAIDSSKLKNMLK